MSTEAEGAERERPLSVSALVSAACRALDEGVGEVWVRGEVFEAKTAASGHHYFTLADAEAKLDAKLWRGVAARGLRCELERGAAVLVHGRLDVYAPNGRLSLIADRVEAAGAGDLARRFEELKQRLLREGLFDPLRKRALPPRPRRLVLITGKGSAAEADVLRVLAASRAPVQVLLRHARVQGAGATEELARALDECQTIGADLILLARGGGSLEDLWAFNEEILVRAVAASAVPVISAVGHETDVTLCDFAADLRAITPTDGARRAVAGWRQALARVEAAGESLLRGAAEGLRLQRARVDRALQQLLRQAPQRRLERARWSLGETHRRLLEAGAAGPAQARRRAVQAARRLERRDPTARAALFRARLRALGERLTAADPHGLLARGWALVEVPGRPGFLRSAQEVASGDPLRIRLAQGVLAARVE